MKNSKIYALPLLLIVLFSCEETDKNSSESSKLANNVAKNENLTITYGERLGNIMTNEPKSQIIINGQTATYQVFNRENTLLKNCENVENTSEYEKILSTINFDTFKKIPEIANCGSESIVVAIGDVGFKYLKIANATESHEIRISNLCEKDPDGLTGLLDLLREKKAKLKNTCN
jgi:hypothetical protein